MGVPFAEICTDSPRIWNVQLGFWRDAVEHFEAMVKNVDVYEDEAIFGVDAAIVLVLAGTSVSILLGQQWSEKRLREHNDSEGRVPAPTELLKRLLNKVTVDNPDVVKNGFAHTNMMHEAIRHFGEPKHETVGELNYVILVQHLKLLQTIWNLVIEWRNVNDQYIPCDFKHEFTWPAS